MWLAITQPSCRKDLHEPADVTSPKPVSEAGNVSGHLQRGNDLNQNEQNNHVQAIFAKFPRFPPEQGSDFRPTTRPRTI